MQTPTSHTPGPWSTDPSSHLHIKAGCELIAAVNSNRRLVIPGQAQADAHLIAAAPHLFAALKVAELALSQTLKARGYVSGSCTDEWAPEVRTEVAALSVAQSALATADAAFHRHVAA